jgi:hypothetical protein
MKVIVNLSGWADGLSADPRKCEFPIQMALYEVFRDCDWNLKVLTCGSNVLEEFKIKVTAKRCRSRLYKKNGTMKSDYTTKKFAFSVPQYTLANIYTEAVKALREFMEGSDV